MEQAHGGREWGRFAFAKKAINSVNTITRAVTLSRRGSAIGDDQRSESPSVVEIPTSENRLSSPKSAGRSPRWRGALAREHKCESDSENDEKIDRSRASDASDGSDSYPLWDVGLTAPAPEFFESDSEDSRSRHSTDQLNMDSEFQRNDSQNEEETRRGPVIVLSSESGEKCETPRSPTLVVSSESETPRSPTLLLSSKGEKKSARVSSDSKTHLKSPTNAKAPRTHQRHRSAKIVELQRALTLSRNDNASSVGTGGSGSAERPLPPQLTRTPSRLDQMRKAFATRITASGRRLRIPIGRLAKQDTAAELDIVDEMEMVTRQNLERNPRFRNLLARPVHLEMSATMRGVAYVNDDMLDVEGECALGVLEFVCVLLFFAIRQFQWYLARCFGKSPKLLWHEMVSSEIEDLNATDECHDAW